VRQRFERGNGHNLSTLHECESLYRRDADPQPCKRTWPGCDGKDIHRGETRPRLLEHREDFTGQSLSMGARRIAASLDDNPIVFNQCHAAAARCRVQSQHTHRLHYT